MTDELFPAHPSLAPDAPRGLGAAIAGGKGPLSTVPRQKLDFYPTPPLVTRALIAAEGASLRRAVPVGGAVWEPCGRGGAIARELNAAGFETVATDVVPDPANAVSKADVRLIDRAPSHVAITNPPFAIAADIITHLLGDLHVEWLALLLKAAFWHAEERTGLWRRFPPARIHALNWRPDFLGGGAPTMDVIWCVWQRCHFTSAAPETLYAVLPRSCATPAPGLPL